MTTPPAAEPDAETPFLPPAVPVTQSSPSSEPSALTPPTAPGEPPQPVYGAMPSGTDESRAAARRLREQANRKRRRGRAAVRTVGVLVLAAAGVGGYFGYRASQDDSPTADDGAADQPGAGAATETGTNAGAATDQDTEQDTSGILDAIDDARDVVGQTEPPVAGGAPLLVADLLTPAVLDHTEVLAASDGFERFVVRTGDLAEIDPNSHAGLVERLLALPQAVAGEPQLTAAPVVLPGDIGIAIQRDGDMITRLVAVGTEPTIRSIGP